MRTLVYNALRLTGKRTAIGHHIEYLARAWSRMEVPFDRILLLSPGELRLDDLGSRTRVELHTIGSGWPNLLWEQWVLPRAANGAAALFCEYNCPLWYGGRVILCNHGIYEAAGQRKTFSAIQRLRSMPLNKLSCRRADRIIANSLSTRRDVSQFFRVPEEKIDIVYPAAADLFFQEKDSQAMKAEVLRTLGRETPYVIFVGKLSRRRNVPNLIEAFAKVRRERQLPHHLLIVGPNTSDLPIADLITHSGAAAFIHYLPYAEQSRLALLYAAADLYVLPSTYEGISWTMFEAMASGTAVLAVDHPALVEGGADAVMSVLAPTVEELARGMGLLLGDAELRRSYQTKGLARAQRFTMAECVKATMAVIDRYAAPSDRRGYAPNFVGRELPTG